MKLLKNVSSKVKPLTMKLYFIANENWAILCGIGLMLVVALILINEVVAENVKKLEARYSGGKFDVHLFREPPRWRFHTILDISTKI